ncbi:MAG TPA: protoporphyrinogen oxidase [Chloroflexi bacterium]|nr:protoporphyrinogen oxidase [Chloroflexota bacterium]
MTHHPVAIIGGGIAGLSAAWYLQKAGIDYVLLEQDARWGGKIRTETVTGYGDAPFIVEGGPDSFITQKPWGAALARELGLGEALIGTNEQLKQTYVLNKGKATPLPDGVLMIVPTKFKPFIFSPLISPWGKLRMGMDLFIPRRKDERDETLAEFVRRRLGSEALDKIAEPLMSGIYNAEAEKQSVLATFPRFRELEQQYGSLTKGMLASQRARQQSAATMPRNGRPLSFFVTPIAGVAAMVDALSTQLTGDLRLGVGVVALEPASGGYHLHLTDGADLNASQVILATPAFVTGALLRPLAPDAADLLDGIRYVSTGTISLAFRSADAPNPLNGYGLVIPMSERRPINAITLNSVKFAQRAPDGHLLLRAFFGGSRSPQSMELDDSALYTTVRRELDALLGIAGEPLFHRIYRWRRSNPQYDVGHLERVAAIERSLPPGVHVAGSAYRGVGIPDCVKSALEAVGRVTAA